MIPPRFTLDDGDRAYHEWGANCGPGALAAIMGMTLDEVRPHMGDFETKHYTNPSLMNAALRSVGRPWRKIGGEWPAYGLVRIQWEGPWTLPGVPFKARYRYTHWVGAEKTATKGIGIFDINAMNNGSGWCALADWASIVAPFLATHHDPRATGGWHITHAIEVDPDPAARAPADRYAGSERGAPA